MLLLAHHVAEFLHHLALAVLAALSPLPALAAFRHAGQPAVLHCLQHALHLLQHLARLVAIAHAGHVLGLIHHVLQVVGRQRLLILAELLQLLAASQTFHRVAHHLLHQTIHRFAHLVHQLLDFLVIGIAVERILQAVHQSLEILLGLAAAPILDMQGGLPQQALHGIDRFRAAVERQPRRRGAHAQMRGGVLAIELRRQRQGAQGGDDALPLPRMQRQFAALLDDRLGDRVVEAPRRQRHRHRFAAAVLADRVGGDQRHLDVQSGPGMRGQVEFLPVLDIAGRGRRRRPVHRHRLLGLVTAQFDPHLLHAVIVAGREANLQFVALAGFRRLGEVDHRRLVGNHLQLPFGEGLVAPHQGKHGRLALGQVQRKIQFAVALVDGLQVLFLLAEAQREAAWRRGKPEFQLAAGRDRQRLGRLAGRLMGRLAVA